MGAPEPKDLIVLVADSHQRAAMLGILSQGKAMGVRPLVPDIDVHPHHDPGCLLEAHVFLRSFARAYRWALVLFDREGCGQDDQPRQVLEERVEERLARSGWDGRSAVVVIDPELEAWVWSDSPHVDAALGWKGKTPGLREWLSGRDLLPSGQVKPARPKEAMLAAMREVGGPRSATTYRNLAERVSLQRCQDPAFVKLKTVLRTWFPVGGS